MLAAGVIETAPDRLIILVESTSHLFDLVHHAAFNILQSVSWVERPKSNPLKVKNKWGILEGVIFQYLKY